MEQNLVYDIGMNDGDDTAYYLSLGYNVVAVEAIPDLVLKAEKRFKHFIESGRLKIVNVGIAEKDGLVNFYVNKYDSGWSSFHLHLANRGNRGYDVIEIETKSLNQVISEYGTPYYVKVDIEGYDIVALNSLFACKEKPMYLSVELYDLNGIKLLEQLGYKNFKIIDQQSFLPLELPETFEYYTFKKLNVFKSSKNFFFRVVRKLFGSFIIKKLEARFKRNFKYSHTLGTSGPFGSHGFGKWHSYDEIQNVFQNYKSRFEQTSGGKEFGWWIDLHATL